MFNKKNCNKDSNSTLSSMTTLIKEKSISLDSNDTLNTIDTLDSQSHSIRSRTNSISIRAHSNDLDMTADVKTAFIEKEECIYNHYINDDKNNYIEINSAKKSSPKRIRDQKMEAVVAKSPNISSILEKIPSLNLHNLHKNNKNNEITSNIRNHRR